MSLLGALVLAAATVVGPLGEGDPCSTEASTNVVFRAGEDVMKALALSIGCEATPSNSVQVAFGRDADCDGVLQTDEAALTVGWRCGAWFVRDELSGEETAEARPCGSRVLDWRLTVGSDGRPKHLVATTTDRSSPPSCHRQTGLTVAGTSRGSPFAAFPIRRSAFR